MSCIQYLQFRQLCNGFWLPVGVSLYIERGKNCSWLFLCPNVFPCLTRSICSVCRALNSIKNHFPFCFVCLLQLLLSLSVSLSPSICLCLCVCAPLSVSFSVCLSVFLSLPPSVCVSLSLSPSVSVYHVLSLSFISHHHCVSHWLSKSIAFTASLTTTAVSW